MKQEKANTVWLLRDTGVSIKAEQLPRDDPRFAWDNPHAPQGMVAFFRSPNNFGCVPFDSSKKGWKYVWFGETLEELCENANRHTMFRLRESQTELEKLKERISSLESLLVRPEMLASKKKGGEN